MSMTARYLRVDPKAIRRIRQAPSTLLDVLYPEPEPTSYASIYLDIDKTWHIIHFLLNDDPWEGEGPLSDAVLGGSQLTDEDLGYGPARFLHPAEVAATAQALGGVSGEELWSRFDKSRVRKAELYWETGRGSRSYALQNYKALQRFFRAARQARQSVILWLA
jgi:hypothetical protein